MRHDTTRLSRREALAAGVAGAATLAGCNGLGLGGGFEFPDGAPDDEQKAIVRTFVQRVHDGEYEAARGPFTDEMRDTMSADRIESVWNEEVGDLGAYQGIGLWGIESREENDAVFARVECESGHYALQVTLRDEQIAGLFIRHVETE